MQEYHLWGGGGGSCTVYTPAVARPFLSSLSPLSHFPFPLQPTMVVPDRDHITIKLFSQHSKKLTKGITLKKVLYPLMPGGEALQKLHRELGIDGNICRFSIKSIIMRGSNDAINLDGDTVATMGIENNCSYNVVIGEMEKERRDHTTTMMKIRYTEKRSKEENKNAEKKRQKTPGSFTKGRNNRNKKIKMDGQGIRLKDGEVITEDVDVGIVLSSGDILDDLKTAQSYEIMQQFSKGNMKDDFFREMHFRKREDFRRSALNSVLFGTFSIVKGSKTQYILGGGGEHEKYAVYTVTFKPLAKELFTKSQPYEHPVILSSDKSALVQCLSDLHEQATKDEKEWDVLQPEFMIEYNPNFFWNIVHVANMEWQKEHPESNVFGSFRSILTMLQPLNWDMISNGEGEDSRKITPSEKCIENMEVGKEHNLDEELGYESEQEDEQDEDYTS